MNDSQAIFSQLDSRWARNKIGNSVCTIRDWGCTITAICRALFQLTGKVFTPAEMEDKLKFTNDGRVLWQSLSGIGLKAVRGYGKPVEFKKGMLIELDYNPRHWVTFEEMKGSNAIMVMDPLKAAIVPKMISDISGFTTLEAIDISVTEPNEWEKEVKEAREWVMKNGISNGDRPKEFVTREEQWVMVHRLVKKLTEF